MVRNASQSKNAIEVGGRSKRIQSKLEALRHSHADQRLHTSTSNSNLYKSMDV